MSNPSYTIRHGDTNQPTHIAPFFDEDFARSWAEIDDSGNKRMGRPRHHYLLVKDGIIIDTLDFR